ncbi:MAG: hypothetical protein JXJ20_08285 [Anaerolineae bacterium]|nr:hypothetical protein [Anaerolineae bacterium]
MRLDFMTPDVWNGLVLGVVLIGLSLAILRLYSDLSRPVRKRSKQAANADSVPPPPFDTPPQGD